MYQKINVNVLIAPPKDTDWLNAYKKRPIYICCLQETHFRPKDTNRLIVRGWKNIFHVNGKQKKGGVEILISDKIDLKKKITRDKEGHYIMIKGSIQEEDITIVNIYAPNIGAPQYIRQTLTDIKGEVDSNTIIVGEFNTPLTPMDRLSKQKINKETQVLNDTLDGWISLISSEHSTQMQKNTCSSQLHMEHSPRQTTSWITIQTSVNLRKLKLYQASFLTTML